MGFLDRLRENPGGNSNMSGIYGMPPVENDDEDALKLVNRLRDRDMQDYKDKAEFDSGLSLRQEQRMRSMFDPKLELDKEKMAQSSNLAQQELGFKANESRTNQLRADKEFELGRDKLSQSGKMGQEALDIKTQQEKLNETKNTQINEDRDADRQRKTDEMSQKIEQANQRITIAQQALEDKTADAAAKLAAHKEMAAAVEERHKLELENKQHEFNTTTDLHKQQIATLEKQIADKLAQSQNTEQETKVSPDGTTKVVTTKRGDAATKVQVLGKDGKTYTIPKDKLDDKDADGTPHWKQIGG
jgi:hypothetical protein